jgi:hypothetical protein
VALVRQKISGRGVDGEQSAGTAEESGALLQLRHRLVKEADARTSLLHFVRRIHVESASRSTAEFRIGVCRVWYS